MSDRRVALSQWLAEVLGTTDFHLEPLAGDASFRRYWRAVVAERRYVVMDAPPPEEDCGRFVAIARRLGDAGLHVPSILHDDLEAGFLVLDDLGDALYLDALTAETADGLYRDALRALVQMQRATRTEGLPHYDAARLGDEMALFPEWFLARHLQIKLGARERQTLDGAFAWLIERALAQPQVFVHRDYHSRNLMVHAPNPAIIDFQDAVVGPLTYDLVSLFRDVYIDWPDARITDWIAAYCALATDAKILTPRQVVDVPGWFDAMGVQRHLKVAGIFARLYYRDGKPRYLDDLPLTIRYLTDVTRRLPELSALAALLERLNLADQLAAARTREAAT